MKQLKIRAMRVPPTKRRNKIKYLASKSLWNSRRRTALDCTASAVGSGFRVYESNLMLSHGVVLKWLRCLSRVHGTGKDIMQAMLARKNVLQDVGGLIDAVEVDVAVEHV